MVVYVSCFFGIFIKISSGIICYVIYIADWSKGKKTDAHVIIFFKNPRTGDKRLLNANTFGKNSVIVNTLFSIEILQIFQN